MNHSRWHLAYAMMTLLAPWGGCTVDTGMPGAAAELDGEAEPPAPELDSETLAEVKIPTEDGKASYRFRFARVVDGPMLTTIESPLGYPVPQVPTECALDTFLRVAPADSLVPAELIAHCLTPAERVERGLPETGEVSVRAEGLQDPTSRLELDYQAAAAEVCTIDDFDVRVSELEALAAYLPDTLACDPPVCEYGALWDLTGCAFVDEDGNNQGACSPLEHQHLLATYGTSGLYCMTWAPPACAVVPDVSCTHPSFVLGDWGPYGVWQRTSNGFSETTRVRVEVSVCSIQQPGTGWWRMKRNAADAFGALHPLSFAPGALTTLILSAGTDSNNDWEGWDFDVQASGNNMHVISAWVYMQGLNRSQCPVAF